MSNLTRRAMLVKLSISCWEGKKRDSDLGKEVAESHNSDEDMFAVVKSLVPKDEFSNLSSIISQTRTFHRTNTFPWSYGNISILASDNYMTYMEKMNDQKATFMYYVEDFLDKWETILERSKQKLNGAFDPSQYPTRQQLERKFGFSIAVFPIPDAPHIALDLSDDEVNKIKEQTKEELVHIENIVKEQIWERLQGVVDNMIATLEEYDPNKEGKEKKSFNKQLINSTTEILESLGRMNVTEDSKFDEFRKKALSRLTRVDAKTLREDDSERERVLKDAKEIQTSVMDFMKN